MGGNVDRITPNVECNARCSRNQPARMNIDAYFTRYTFSFSLAEPVGDVTALNRRTQNVNETEFTSGQVGYHLG
jgi:hypothetical protein